MKRTHAADTLLILLLATVLIWPLFRLKYMENWESIESTFISDARMLGDHLPHPGWQPLWYTGTRFDYIYPPALRYGPALIAKAFRMTTARAYHLYTALLYIFGIAAVYWLTLAGTRSRAPALFASAATALISPGTWLFGKVRADTVFHIPQRLRVLAGYGEGPHISALCVLPAALAVSIPALRAWRPGYFALAAVLCAATVSNNFYGATALAMFFPCLVWAVWIGERDWRVPVRAAGIAALAWGLCAFWLTPSYLAITIVNLRWVSQPGNTPSTVAALIVISVFGAATWLWARGRRELEWPVFATGAALLFTLDVAGFYFFGFRIAGEPARLVPEFDLALILAFATGLHALWKRPRLRTAAIVLALASLTPAAHYLRHAWFPFPKAGPVESQYTYRISRWVHENLPGQRTLPAGEVRLWYDAWFDNAQTDGGSLQGMENQILPVAFYQIQAGPDPRLALAWLQALGTDAVVVTDATSPDTYRDYPHPEKFAGAAPVLYNDGHGTVIYRVPRLYPNLARMVDAGALISAGHIRGGDDMETLTKYLSVVEAPGQTPANVEWKGFDEVRIDTDVASGKSLLLQETYDESWHAHEAGQPQKELTIRRDPVMGFMLIDAPAGARSIVMNFKTPAENRAGQVVTGFSLLLGAGLLAAGLGGAATFFGSGAFTGLIRM